VIAFPAQMTSTRWLVVASLVLAHPAWAVDPPARNPAIGEALFRHGRQLLDQGKVAEACEKFAASQAADPAVGTLLNLAACHERDGRTATAWSEFTDAGGQAAAANDKTRAEYARTRAAALEKNLYRVTIDVLEKVPELVVKLDGQPLAREALGTPLPFDPGERTIEASAPGRAPWSQKVTIPRATGQQRIEIPPLAANTAPLPMVTPETPPIVTAVPLVEEKPALSNRRKLAIGIGGYGVAAVAVGAAFGLKAMGRQSDMEKHCQGSVCDPEGAKLNDQAKSAATVSTIVMGTGIAALGAAAVLWFLPSRESGVSAAPVLTAGGAGVSLAGRF
jgi:hypothetical protein